MKYKELYYEKHYKNLKHNFKDIEDVRYCAWIAGFDFAKKLIRTSGVSPQGHVAEIGENEVEDDKS